MYSSMKRIQIYVLLILNQLDLYTIYTNFTKKGVVVKVPVELLALLYCVCFNIHYQLHPNVRTAASFIPDRSK